jgi:hypothetical protein
MKKTLIATAVAACVTAPIGAHAVNVGSNGEGEVLLFPYYNTNEGNATFLNVTNTTDDGKVIKVRFREGVESEDIFDFQLWLSPHDHWSGVIAVVGDGILLSTADTSCTVPTVLNNPNARFLPNRIPDIYEGDVLTRMSEGHIEVIEMGTVVEPLLLADITHDQSVSPPTPACELVRPFNTDVNNYVIRTLDNLWLGEPTGGLYGLAAVYNPGDGTYFTYSAEAIQQFAATPIFYTQQELVFPAGFDHTADEYFEANTQPVLYFDLPDISTPDGNEGAAGTQTIVSFQMSNPDLPNVVPITVGQWQTDGAGVPNTLPLTNTNAPDAKRDAITTTMMASRVNNDYLTGPAFDTDWVFTFPGRYLYRNFVTPDIYTMEPPFQSTIGGVDRTNGQSCQDLASSVLYGREEERFEGDGIDFSPGTTPDVFSLCYEVNVIAINDAAPGYSSALGSLAVRANATSQTNFGWGDLAMDNQLVDSAGTIHVGLPVIGFSAVTDRTGVVDRGATFLHKITRGVTLPQPQ